MSTFKFGDKVTAENHEGVFTIVDLLESTDTAYIHISGGGTIRISCSELTLVAPVDSSELEIVGEFLDGVFIPYKENDDGEPISIPTGTKVFAKLSDLRGNG